MMAKRFTTAAICVAVIGLAGCGSLVPGSDTVPSARVIPPDVSAESARMAGVTRGPAIKSLGMGDGDAATALASFVESCPKLLIRDDKSGLTNKADWRASCDAANAWPASRAEDFFGTHFDTVIVGDGEAFATGYFEPEILGCRTKQSGCETPIYAMPDDLKRAWPANVPDAERTGRAPLGRTNAAGDHVLYYERAEIEDGALAGRGLEIAYAADPVELFFLQIQGGDGPLGALSVPVRRESSVAADPLFVPLGAPVWLDMDDNRADGMWIAQDTGGAIKGANRFDTFWGAGEDARLTAGGMSARGNALLFLPKSSVQRLDP